MSSGVSTADALKTDDGQQQPAEELNLMIDDLLNDLTSKFTAVASEITAKMDDMSRRIDNLESSIRMQRSDLDGPKEA
ncbi:MAG: hypothetical protein MMC23_007699 [Stictis urceolatum]|nr:hypothetical protein [Stictis urceolata]